MNLPTQEDMYNKVLDYISKIISHPHPYTTIHDKHRAIAVIDALTTNSNMIEYLYSQLTEEEHKLVAQIQNFTQDFHVDCL